MDYYLFIYPTKYHTHAWRIKAVANVGRHVNLERIDKCVEAAPYIFQNTSKENTRRNSKINLAWCGLFPGPGVTAKVGRAELSPLLLASLGPCLLTPLTTACFDTTPLIEHVLT